ncbi:acyltransferase family protein [Flavobacterium sp. FZUC8N2.13]|uniref:Acyltransferase family protein n=1 Tax=Flavobacterium zubiriense TaxID=3138075 RepID=A0ABV4TAD2_9FLAO
MNNLRALATFSVVVLHVSFPLLCEYGVTKNNDWQIGNFFDSAVRFCVPIFLMLTGALLLAKPIEIESFFKKRFLKILLPFLFWSSIYVVYGLNLKYDKGEILNFLESFKFVYLQFKDGASYHLWYIYMLIGLYLFFPILNKWVLNSEEKEIRYFIIFWFFVMLVKQPYLCKFIPAIDLTYFSGYIDYLVLGYYLAFKFNYKKIKLLSVLIYVVGFGFTFLGTAFKTIHQGNVYTIFYDYLSPNVIIEAIGVFLFFKSFSFQNTKLESLIDIVSKHSYGIYLSHVLMLTILYKLGITYSFINPFIAIPLTSILCMILSLSFIVLLKKVPFINSFIG